MSLCLLLCLGLLPGCRPGLETSEEGVTVFAAASLREAVQDISSAFEARTRGRVRHNFGSSGMLARQIARGAPADVFISANTLWMDTLVEAGLVVPGTRVDLLGNALVVVQPAYADRPLREPADLLQVSLLALADTVTAPAGLYAREFLEAKGLWEPLARRRIEAMNVRAALLLVERGEADAGIVYATDARASPKVVLCFAIDPADHSPIIYPAALVKRDRQADTAETYFRFLRSPDAAARFRQFGYTVLHASPDGT